jgi:hypothetical protein
MVLVPSFIDVDGLIVPLEAWAKTDSSPARVFLRTLPKEPRFEGLSYVLGSLLTRPAVEVLQLLRERSDLPVSQELCANYWSISATEDEEEMKSDARIWEGLTGYRPDLSDVYSIGASFLRDGLVIPRLTFLKLMEQLYQLNAEVRDGRREARIDETMPVPPPRPPLPPLLPPWNDDFLLHVEHRAVQLDELAPLTLDASEQRDDDEVFELRSLVHSLLHGAYLRVLQGDRHVADGFARLGLTTSLAYRRAEAELAAYLADPERVALVDQEVADAKAAAGVTGPVTAAEIIQAGGYQVSPYTQDVSIDLFRLPQAARPPELSPHQWLARCEAAFLRARIGGAEALGRAGELRTELAGHPVRFNYRLEDGPPVLRLWRVELA